MVVWLMCLQSSIHVLEILIALKVVGLECSTIAMILAGLASQPLASCEGLARETRF